MIFTHLPCPTGCGRDHAPGQVMCRPCWGEVPQHLRRDVYGTWRAYRKARRALPWNPLRVQQAHEAARTARNTALGAIR